MIRHPNNRNQLVPAALLLVIVFILIFLAYRFTTGQLRTPTPTTFLGLLEKTSTVSPRPSRTPSPTMTLTPRPSWTLRPSSTATITPTSTPTATISQQPTLTPANPLQRNDRYKLVDWSPARADQLLTQLNPDSLFPRPADRQKAEYLEAFDLATIAYREALLRFPESPLADQWRWGYAYLLTHVNAPQSGELYTNLITEALNAKQVILEDLSGWFFSREHRLSLQVIPMPPLPGYLSNQIVTILGKGGVYFWLLESPNGFQSYLLHSYFDYTNDTEAFSILADLTNDSGLEIAIYHTPVLEESDISPPHVFDLSETPPVELPVAQSLPFRFGLDHPVTWEVQTDSTGSKQLIFNSTILPSCPVVVSRKYTWDGRIFKPGEIEFNINPVIELLGYCELIADHASLVWGPETAIQLIEPLLPSWPPAQDLRGKPYPSDARDEWSYRLGVLYALAGNPAKAIGYLEKVIDAPTSPSSQWIGPAGQFMDTYRQPEDLYKACQASPVCNLRDALRQVVSTVPQADYNLLPAYLQQFVIPVRSSGIFDFEMDEDPERWVLVQHTPLQQLELWILARTSDAVHPLFVDQLDTGNPVLRYFDPESDEVIVQWKQKEGFILKRVDGSLKPYIVHVNVEFRPTTYSRDALLRATEALLRQGNAQQALEILTDLLDSGKFNCTNYHICDRFYYTIGLAYEMTGQESQAIEWYLRLWREYRSSPLTIAVRLKLALIGTSTPTPTNTLPAHTPAGSVTITSTATQTRTPTIETPYP